MKKKIKFINVVGYSDSSAQREINNIECVHWKIYLK